jgi:hypothetical protein
MFTSVVVTLMRALHVIFMLFSDPALPCCTPVPLFVCGSLSAKIHVGCRGLSLVAVEPPICQSANLPIKAQKPGCPIFAVKLLPKCNNSIPMVVVRVFFHRFLLETQLAFSGENYWSRQTAKRTLHLSSQCMHLH